MTVPPRSPYKGLNAFDDSDLDALFFFGRERECEIVVANLIASRLTVLYGPSGVGKSSLLRAAVARRLRELPEQPIVVVFSRWSDDPAVALAEAVAEVEGMPSSGSPVTALERAQTSRDVYLILDQAEEYFLYHADDSGPGSFVEELPAVVATPLRVNVLVSIRDDSLSKLDRFTGRIPSLFGNTLRLDRLDRTAARAAVVRPLERYTDLTGESASIEPQLVERILDEVGAGQIESALGGLGVVEGAPNGTGVEAPYLQLVLQRLWDAERELRSEVLRLDTFEQLGGAQHIVEEHLSGALADLTGEQKDVAARLFNHLVTPSGTKIAHEVGDLADFGEVTVAELRPVLDVLTERRILRSLEEGADVRYEIFHDVLAEPVLAWRAEHESDRELELQREASNRRQRRLLGVIGVGSVLFAVMAAVTLYALSQRSEARSQALESRAHRLEARADAELGRDPELSILLALEAVRTDPGPTAEETLRQTLLASRVRRTMTADEPLLDATARGNELIAASADGDVLVSSATSDAKLTRISSGIPAEAASFSSAGTVLLTGRDGVPRLLERDGSMRPIPGVTDASGAELSDDGRLAAILTREGVRLVDVTSGRVLHEYPHRGASAAAISPDNRRVLTGGIDDRVYVWSGQSGRRVHRLTDHTGHAVALAFSPDGSYVASAGTDGSARVWRTQDWGLQSTLGAHMTALTDVDFSTDGNHVVTSSKDGTARVLLTESGTPLVVLAGDRDWVTSAAFSGVAGSSVVTSSRDGTARVWDASFQPELEALAELGMPVSSVEVDAQGGLRVGTQDGRTHLLDLGTGDELSVGPDTRSRGRIVGPDGTTATIRANTVVLRRPDGLRSVLAGHRDRVRSVSFTEAGDRVVTSSRDHDVRIWDVETGEAIGFPLQHNSEVHDARFSSDGRWIVTAANRAALFDARTGLLVLRLQGHDGSITSAAFAPDGRTIVTGGDDGTVRRYVCETCGGLDALVSLAEKRLAATGRVLSPDEREQYLR
jgi:WD40 repeat protein